MGGALPMEARRQHKESPPVSDPVMRQARCACGALTAEATGEPAFVAMCSCTECQRRTGSPFAVAAYFLKTQVETRGDDKTYRRISERERWMDFHFCPECGTTLWWLGEFQPDKIAVAVGCFTDPAFPGPEVAVWNTHRHDWLDELADVPTYDEQRY